MTSLEILLSIFLFFIFCSFSIESLYGLGLYILIMLSFLYGEDNKEL